MGIVKIQQVRNLSDTIDYLSQENKIPDELVSYHHVLPSDIYGSFKQLTDQYNQVNGRDSKIKARMIIQSFSIDDDITAIQAHEIAKELCKNYFKDEFQYVIYTHQDADHIHNHILFNSVNINTLRMFDSSRKNTIDNLRNESDKILRENDLIVIEPKDKRTGISFSEYLLKSQGKSFKGKLENTIDKVIKDSVSFDDFIFRMASEGYQTKPGKYLMFKNDKMKRFVRTKTLGVHYTENSIKYRLSNKDFIPAKQNIIDKKWIDKSQEKFKNNIGLRKWASRENIKFYQEVLKNLRTRDLDDINNQEDKIQEVYEKLKNKIDDIDNKLIEFDKLKDSFSVYQDSYSLIKAYKKSDNKADFKRQHYQEFKRYDKAKRDLYILEKKHNIVDERQLNKVRDSLLADRDILYAEFGERQVQKDIQRDMER